jgi:hypothetical protein
MLAGQSEEKDETASKPRRTTPNINPGTGIL